MAEATAEAAHVTSPSRVRPVMLSGDSHATAQHIAAEVRLPRARATTAGE